RLGREKDSPYKPEVHARQDALRAIRTIRSRTSEWGVDPNRLGVMGFSAGGEVASMLTFGATAGQADAADPIVRADARPNFLIQIYPGPLGIPDAIPKDAPPAFLLAADDDRGASRVIAGLFQKYRAAGVPVEAHVFAHGGHGFNMGNRSKLATIK